MIMAKKKYLKKVSDIPSRHEVAEKLRREAPFRSGDAPIHRDRVEVSSPAGISPDAMAYDRYWMDRSVEESPKFRKKVEDPRTRAKYKKNIGSFYHIEVDKDTVDNYQDKIEKSETDYEVGCEKAHFEWDHRFKWYKKTGEGLVDADRKKRAEILRRKGLKARAEELRKGPE